VYAWYPSVLANVQASAEFMAGKIIEGSTISAVLQKYAGITDLNSSELAYIENYNTTEVLLLYVVDMLLLWLMLMKFFQPSYAIAKVISDRASIGWTTHGHTGM
jgi:alkaline phosphatase